MASVTRGITGAMTASDHIDETVLELYVLGSPEVRERGGTIASHLEECAACRHTYEEMAAFYRDVEGELREGSQLPALPGSGLPARRQSAAARRPRQHDMPATHRVEIAWPVRAGRWITRHPAAAAAGATASVGLVVAALFLWTPGRPVSPADRNPVIAGHAGEMLLLENRSGVVVDSVRVGLQNVREYRRSHHVAFFDTDHDGRNEIFWTEISPNVNEALSRICCKEAGDASPRWSVALDPRIEFLHQPSFSSAAYFCGTLDVGDFDGDGRAEVVVVAHQTYAPTLVLEYDAATGRELGRYVHVGSLGRPIFVDLDRNGIRNIIVSGVNQSLQEACLVVLDPRMIRGHGPQADRYAYRGASPGLERAYLRIPRSIIGDTVEPTRQGFYGIASPVDSLRGLLRVRVQDAGAVPGNTYGDIEFTVDFGYDLRVMSTGTGDNYDRLARRLLEEGRIPMLPDSSYWHKYIKGIMYWNGESWQRDPVKNRRYESAIQARRNPLN